MEKRVLDISWAGLWKVLFFMAVVAVLVKGLSVFLGLFLAVVISSGIEFMVDFMERRGIPRTLGVILIFLVFALLVFLVLYAVIPLLLVDVMNTFSDLPQKSNVWWASLVSFQTSQSFAGFVNKISAQFLSQNASPFASLSNLFGGVALAISIVISAFYLSLSRDGVERFIKAVLPDVHLERTLRIYARARRRIGTWFRTQIILSVTMAVLVWAVLFVLQVPHSFVLGFLAGVFELVPFLGPILAGAAAVLSALEVSSPLGLYTLIAFLFVHQVENHLLVPLLAGRNLGLHPVIVIMALLVGAEAAGLLGILISVPLAVVLQEIIEDWTAQKNLKRHLFSYEYQ